MDVGTLIGKGNRKLAMTLDNQLWYDYFNDCMLELTPILRLEAKTTIPVTAGILKYTAPSNLFGDYINLARLQTTGVILNKLNLDDYNSTGYKLYDNTIELQFSTNDKELAETDDTLELFYYRTPTLITTNSQVPDIPEPFQPILIFYGCSKYNQSDEEPENESSFWKDYLILRQQLDRYTKRRASGRRLLQWDVRRGIYG